MATKFLWLLLTCLGFCAAWMDERPVLESRDGNLFISAAKDRNITFKILGNGCVNVNEINLLHVASAAQNATHFIERLKRGYLAEIEANVERLTGLAEGSAGTVKKMAVLMGIGEGNTTAQPGAPMSTQSLTKGGTIKVRALTERVRRLEVKVKSIESKLKINECSSNPCQNGGSCQDLYEGYQCHCPSNWEGPNCLVDVNECVRLLGTDLGCQNGATCINLPGSYRCDCTTGWFGIHCTKKSYACNTQNSEELCGHGVCVNKPSSPLGYTCICDQGWQSDDSNPACTKDVDECAGKHPACSVNPWVACRNAPGTFFCDPCPRGYTGNGYYCTDIDECLVDNGGCSTAPRVQCINTMGSRMCGPCPTGYRGDGVTCIYVGGCAINNGGCHPLATCVENAALTSAYVLCRCPAGFAGDGIGPNGCTQTTDVSSNSACSSNPCINGRCIPGITVNSYSCACSAGYTGPTCDVRTDLCSANPCKNNGVCVISNGAVTCDCPSTFTGSRCETPRQTCGGASRNAVGHLEFPVGGNTYQHGLSCAWVVITNSMLVLNVTFSRFNLEESTDCKYDFLQIHDGRNAGSHMIGRFCGSNRPNGSIISTHNALYFWFHSDNSISHDGFSFHWNSIEPVCGDYLTADYGTISSPGSPGRYPPNRDCYWHITVSETKRIQFLFGQLMLEEYPNCERDFLKITDAHDEVLGIYCNHTHPAPLITPGPEATLYFHSDSAGQDSGFQIHYSVVEGVPGCGGVFTTPTGTIHPPLQASTYLPNMECEWKIRMPLNERIQISWLKFDLENSRVCRFDFISIYDGDTRDAPLIGRYCGSNIPPNIKSTSNTLLVLFVSDWSYESEGFTLTYNVLCGGEFTEESGTIQSPMYPNVYQNSRTCNYEIMQPIDKRIVLSIVDLDIEALRPPNCYFDYLEIFDGDSENSTTMATLCGSESYMPTEPYYSTHNYMFLKFTSDKTISGRGFMANYTTIPNKCGGLLKTATGTIQTPNEAGTYNNNEDCVWTLQAPPGYVIQLNWITFSLESHFRCQNDFVKIYENYTAFEGDLLGTFCGSKQPPIIMTQGRVMTIVFHSDASVIHEGFVATYLFVDASKVCGGYFLKQNGVIKSPNYPEKYSRKKECVYHIEAPNKKRIILNVKDFELEHHAECIFDYLEIRNGGYETSPLIGKYCGTNIPTEIISQTNQLYLKFVSDHSFSQKGFKIEWDSTTSGCGGTMTAANGDIISPNYPMPYLHQAECYWSIAVAAGSLVQLIIVDLDLEQHDRCFFDYIEISEGLDRRNGQKYCNRPYPKVIQAKSNIVTVRFRSDYTNSGRGFHLKYETLCQNKLHGFYGVVESPNFPNNYEHALNCSWIIEAPIGNRINITFSHFELEGFDNSDTCKYDYLDIKEGANDSPTTDLAKLCGSQNKPRRIHSTDHQVFVTFVTDELVASKGFRFEWVVDGCGGHLTRPFDSFTSPGYPRVYPTNIECEWLIEVLYPHSIELTIHDINTEKQGGCFFDKLAVYGGEDEQAPKLAEICYSEKPIVYTSFGNKMFLKFFSDISYAAKGFNISYKTVPLSCGGKYTSDSGFIYSTNYPKNYPNKQYCEWLLEVDKNHVVNFTFLDFDLENSRNCTDDSVQIYDGPTKNSPLLGTHCNSELPPSYVSTSNKMLVVMRTDRFISAKGFKAQYRRACGARIIVKDQGYISPSESRNSNTRDDYVNCTWILIAEDPADHVTLTITHMEMDGDYFWWNRCSFNYLEVFEGESIEGHSYGKWCDNVPLPVTSTGNALTMHLSSDYDFAGYFVATYSVLNSACGGTYTSYQGRIASPGYPNSYPLNAECIWILNNSPGSKLSLTFSEFDLQQSENCDLDYLEIREDNGIGKLISTSCGTSIEPVQSLSKLWIKFKSDGTGVSKGFVGEYELEGGNELTGPTGRITSPLYPLPYKQKTIWWRITVQFGWAIQIDIKDLFVENYGMLSCTSSLMIYDGYDDEAPILLNVCNIASPASTLTSSNVAYLKLESSYYRLGSWFDLSWIQVPKETASSNVDIKLSNCSEEIGLIDDSNNTYSFSSPGWPDGYEDNLECNWLFTSPPGTHLVLGIFYMDLEETSNCVADSVSVYSGNALTSASDASLVQRICLSNSTGTWIKATNVMTVKFQTDSFLNKTGFYAKVDRHCGGKLNGPNGVIEIENKTSVRARGGWLLSCEWNVEVRPGRMVQVEFTEIAIHQGPSFTCVNNYIMLKNGDSATSPLLGAGKYCGNVAPAPLQTTGNHLYVKVDGIRPNISFKLTYKEVSNQCGGEFVLSKQQKEWEFNTPNYPNIPPPFSECTWTAIAPSRERISLHFIDRFDLSYSPNCSREYVEVRDGGTEYSRILGRFCKNTAPNSLTSTGNMMFVYFYTDVPEPKNGFKARFITGEVCGGIVRGTSGIITSPNYPFFYKQNLTCTWAIVAPMDHNLKIEFLDIQLPGFRNCKLTDHVEISEETTSENETQTLIGRYCGRIKPEIIETSLNTATVTFKSDNFDRTSYSYAGFSLKFTSSQEFCGGEFTALQGTIKSHGYPKIATRSRYCDWRIKLPRGFQVVVDILDLDIIPVSPFSVRLDYALSFYNDFRFKSRIKLVSRDTTLEQIRSSGNTMMIGYASSPGYRGFKLRYYSVGPAPCGGEINDVNGSISAPTVPPFNESSYYCQWSMSAPSELMGNNSITGVTLSIKVSGMLGGLRGFYNTGHCYSFQYISLSKSGTLCGNITEPTYLRSPRISNELTIINGTYGQRMHFSLDYQWQPCGGILQGLTHVIKTPKNIPYPISCVWFADYPDTGELIRLEFTKLNLSSCDQNYITVRNGDSYAPDINKFCGNMKPYNIVSTSNKLWIEYFASSEPNDFEFLLKPANNGCGGALRGTSQEISSPGFPQQYPNKAECTWELTADNGYHVGLQFVQRFNLEASTDCKNDYVEIFDWNDSSNNESENWRSIGKVCGRNTPAPFNATSNRMKVTFHSNDAIQGDGFSAVWHETCGGVFEVGKTPKVIQSPSYPFLYHPNLYCNYTLISHDKDIIVVFMDFQLESSGRECKFDNLTIVSNDYELQDPEKVYCGDDKPPIIKSSEKVEIIFRTDDYMELSGFMFQYFLNDCGGTLTEPGEIQSLMRGNEYFDRQSCVWEIYAPVDKSIVLRFETFVLEYSRTCSFDYVDVYEGNSTTNSSNKLARLCGNLTEHLPVLKSSSNSMVVNFESDSGNNFKGFKAKVLFVKSVAAGCGGYFNMTTTRSLPFKTQRGSTYESLEDCHWNVDTLPGKNIRLTINSIDVKNSINRTSSDKCSGDYLEVRNGAGPFAELLGKYCGSEIPQPILSSVNRLWIRFYSDGTLEGAGVSGTLEVIDSLCGLAEPIENNTLLTLKSPNYPNPYEPGTKCRWVLRSNYDTNQKIHVEFEDFDLADSDRCDHEFFEIIESNSRNYIEEGFGEDFIWSGSAMPHYYYLDHHVPKGSYKYCGSSLPHDYYSYGTQIQVKFQGDSAGHRGFKLKYGTATCDRNYTAEQGRIVQKNVNNCWFSITAPENSTISLYFNDFILYDPGECTKSFLQVYDGGFNGNLLASLCGVTTPNPIFSNSSKISLHSLTNWETSFERYDITYTSTTHGRGCGGRIYNFAGTFSSPLYPNEYRVNTDCTWDVSVPRSRKIYLEFEAFDLGSNKNCEYNFLKIFDINENGEQTERNSFCGGDNPAPIEADSYRVIITYTSSVNNAGTGWLIKFKANA